jgi:predicted RNA methylase
MKILKDEINGIKFYHRQGFSDLKTFKEVLERKVYLKKGMTINEDDNWMDCGGNVGAFALLVCSLGAKVTVYEPDPYNCNMIEKNLKLNGFKAEIKQSALVHDNKKEIILFIGNNNNVWRNSINKGASRNATT